MTAAPHGLSEDLWEAYRFEIARGNEVVRVDAPAGTRCPLAIVFKLPLAIAEFENSHGLPGSVETWENRDSHYDLERGYLSTRSRHVISGPLPDGRR